MPAIILASDSLEIAQEIAEATATRLDYRVVGRDILSAVADRHKTSEESLRRALDEAPTLLGMSDLTRARLLAAIQEAVLEALVGDRIVCYGLAAHLYVLGISHVLKARVLANPDAMVEDVARRDKVSPDKAKRILVRRSQTRQRWSQVAFGLDENDPELYDLVVKMSLIQPPRIVDILAATIADRSFQPMTYSQRVVRDGLVEARARAVLLAKFADLGIRYDKGVLVVSTIATRREEARRVAAIRALAESLPDVDEVRVEVTRDSIGEAAESLR
jgi:cytidylate kinase